MDPKDIRIEAIPEAEDCVRVTAEQIAVGQLERLEDQGWEFRPRLPGIFRTVSFDAEDQEKAIEQATAWLGKWFREHPEVTEVLGEPG